MAGFHYRFSVNVGAGMGHKVAEKIVRTSAAAALTGANTVRAGRSEAVGGTSMSRSMCLGSARRAKFDTSSAWTHLEGRQGRVRSTLDECGAGDPSSARFGQSDR